MNTEDYKISSGYTVICLLWGSTWLAIRIGLDSLTPVFSAGARFLLASVFIFIIMKIRGIKLQTDKNSLKIYLILGLFSFSTPFALVYWSEQYISSGLTSVLFAVFPFLVTIFSRILIPSEKIGYYKMIGMILGFLGIVIIFSENLTLDVKSDFLPMLFVLLAALMQAWIAVMIKKRGSHLNPLAMNLVPIFFAGLIMLAFGFIIEDRTYWNFDIKAIASITYLAFFGTVITFTTYYWLLKRMNVVILSLTAFITPVIALFIGWIVLDEELSTVQFYGSCFVLIGILFANFRGLKNYLVGKYF